MDINRLAKVKSPLGTAIGLLRMSGREALSQPFKYDLELVSEDPNIDFSALLGMTMSVELSLPNDVTRYFHGYVTQFSLAGGLGRYARYRAVLRPFLWLLTRNANCRVFNERPMKVADLVKEVLRGQGFSDLEIRLSGKYRDWEYRVQYRESDFNFISRLLEQEGIYYYFRHFADRHVLVLADDPASHDPVPGYEKIPYYPPTDQGHRESEHIDGWSMVQQIEAGAYVANDFNFETPKQTFLLSKLVSPDKYTHATYEMYDYPGGYQKPEPDGTSHVQVRLEERKAEHELFQASANARGLTTGALFTLNGFPREDQNKQYLVVSAGYEIVSDAFESGSSAPVPYRCNLTAIDSKRPFRAPETTPKPKVDGPQTALVVGQGAQEITTDKYGRVRVKFHWDRRPEENEKSSCWVRVAQLWAGSAFGAMFLPRVKQEVIVDFLEGDPDRPIIIGRVYNSANMPPYPLDANKTQSYIQSRSTPGGETNNFNEIRFQDKKGEEELHLQAEKNMTTLVKNDQSTNVIKNRSASVGGSDSVSVTGDRSVQVHGNLSISVDGTGKSPIHSTMSVTGKHNVHASDTIDADAPTHIKFVCGGSSITIEPNMITFQAGAGAKIVLDANAFTQANGNGTILVDANVLATSSAGHTALVDGVCVKLAAGSSTVIANTSSVAVNSDTVTANGGPSGVELASAGATMSGPKATVSGAGTTEITGGVVKIN